MKIWQLDDGIPDGGLCLFFSKKALALNYIQEHFTEYHLYSEDCWQNIHGPFRDYLYLDEVDVIEE